MSWTLGEPAEIAALEDWIRAGAADPRVAGSRVGGMGLDEARTWWAFQPLAPRPLPAPDEIDALVFPCLGSLEGCRRLMQEIREKAGFLPAATWLIACGASPADLQWCGTIQGVIDRNRVGMIQNVGIVPGHRGLGLGSCLIGRALAGFRGHGLRAASLEVTADNVRAVKLYQRLGFHRTKTVYKSTDAVAGERERAAAAVVLR